ncbi:leukemia inhibitory factor receptor isoform X2 [Neolamprologus brichardi]|uniref:leukemia inhibitory factor receptor isoform X2 n=1 Tax=Neolamprologus brichardi TaxID=32507 RepID=UPI0003EBEB57|nr:leukemia inhibitory factor receptor isoform X2 [Neolamprologus brichardi]
MINVRKSFFSLFGLYLTFSNTECCFDDGCYLPKPNITLKAINDKQTLVVSWLVKHSSFVGDIYEIELSRTEQLTVIYTKNVSVSPGVSAEYTWTWISDLPLECVDHSVRMRYYNQSDQSPWSNWITNSGFKANDEIHIFPSSRVLRQGSSAMFCCIPPTGVNVKRMTFRNKEYRLLSIGGGVKAITVNNLTIPKGIIKHLLLTCDDATGNSVHVSNYISFPPQKPRNVGCVTFDMVSVSCTWDSPRKRLLHDRNVQIYTLHIENSDKSPFTCEQSSCTFPAVPHLQNYNISVWVKDKLGEEMERYSFNISDRVFPVVKSLSVNRGVTEATVSWSMQESLTHVNLICQVATVPLGTVELRCNNIMSSFCDTKLEHLVPNTKYNVRVRCTVNGRLWGEWAEETFITDPLVSLDLWRRIQPLSNSRTRQVTLMWKPCIAGTAATINIQEYTVQWSQEGQTESKNSSVGQAVVSIGPGKCDFTVQAVLPSGTSIPANITIPPAEHKENLPVQKRLDSTSEGGFNLAWDDQSTATCGYVVEWCMLGNAVPCTPQWKVPEGKFRAGHRYTFYIYGCTDNGYRLLEIQTGYSQEFNSVQRPSLVEPVQSTSSSVTLEWHYNEDDPAQPAFIMGYLVTVQEVGSVWLPDRSNVSVADPHVKFVTIESLKENTEYTCSVSALTKEGPGLPANITFRTKINYSSLIIKVLTPIFLLMGFTVLLWSQVKM